MMDAVDRYFKEEYHYTNEELYKQFGDAYTRLREDLDKYSGNYKQKIDNFMIDNDWYGRRNTPLGWY
jgi:hypothetical protein